MSIKIGKFETSVAVFGGVAKGGAGFGITADGRIIKIPDNNPLKDIAALAEVIAATKSSALRKALEPVVAKQIRTLQR